MKTVRQLRAERGLTQRKLAALLGVHQTTVGGWERKQSRPLPIQLYKLCVLFGVREEELDLARFRGADAPSAPATTAGRGGE